MSNPINPNHYKSRAHECIEFTRHMPFTLGNAFKYVFRYTEKNGVEDLDKALWYIAYQTDSGQKFRKLKDSRLQKLRSMLIRCDFGVDHHNTLVDLLNACSMDSSINQHSLHNAACGVKRLKAEMS